MIRVNLRKEHGLQLLPVALPPTPSQEHVASVPPVLPARPLESKDLVLDWLLAPKLKVSFVDRVLARLVQAEAHEPDVWERENYRQAAIVLTLARRGNTEPFLVSSYQMYGLHPAKLWPAIVAQRKADLGKEYSRWYDENDNLRPSELEAVNERQHRKNDANSNRHARPKVRSWLHEGRSSDIPRESEPVQVPSCPSAGEVVQPQLPLESCPGHASATVIPSPKKPVQSVKPKKEDRNAA